jgi:ribonuclease HI
MNDEEKTTMSKQVQSVIINTDGGSRRNPGPSASAFVITNKAGELIYKEGKYLGITTNNQAEYQAVKSALEKAVSLGARTIEFRMDSLLVVNQMTGIYKIKNRELWPIYTSIKELTQKFEAVTFSHVRREFNKDADRLVNEVLDAQKP